MLHTKEEPPAGPLALLRPRAPLAPTRRRRLTATVDNPAAVVVTKDAPIITIAKNIPKIETQLRISQRKLVNSPTTTITKNMLTSLTCLSLFLFSSMSSNKYYSPASKDHGGYSNYHQSNTNMKRGGDSYYQSSNTNTNTNHATNASAHVDTTTYNKDVTERKVFGIAFGLDSFVVSGFD